MKRILSLILLSSIFVSVFSKSVGMYCFFNDKQTIYEDDYVKCALIVIGNTKVQMVAYNKSDTIVYIDKESSFAYTNNVPVSLYQNKIVTKRTIDAWGLYNTGLFLNNLSISGVSSAETFIEKSVIPIAPHWLTILHEWACDDIILKDNVIKEIKQAIKQGKEGIEFPKKYDEKNTPMAIKAITKYSLDKDLRATKQITISNYIEDIVIDDVAGVKDSNITPQNCKPFSNKQSVKFPVGYNKSLAGEILFGVTILGGIIALVCI